MRLDTSHMGGVWERQIKTVRNVLDALLNDHGTQLDEESLRTLMCEAESIVNSRPLTTDNLTSPNGTEPLTPNHHDEVIMNVVGYGSGQFLTYIAIIRFWTSGQL